MVGAVVLTDYNNRTYKVDDVDFTKSPSDTFMKNGEPVSYIAYYKSRYDRTILDPRQPLLVSRSKARDRRAGAPEFYYLVPELCRLTGKYTRLTFFLKILSKLLNLTIFTKSVFYYLGLTEGQRANFNLMKDLAQHTRVAPGLRMQKLQAFNARLRGQEAVVQDLNRWNFKLDTNLLDVQGRLLQNEAIRFGNGSKSTAKGDFTLEVQKNQVVKMVPLRDWALVVPNTLVESSKSFVEKSVSYGKSMGIQSALPTIFALKGDRVEDYINELERIVSQKNWQIILIVVPNNQVMRYSAIKKKLCIDRPVPCQIILSKNVCHQKENMRNTIATKIAIQIHAKIGGIPWSITLPTDARGLMVVGYDVSRVKSNKQRVCYGEFYKNLSKSSVFFYFLIISF